VIPGFLLYIGGVVVGLFATDAPPAGRLALALLWPLAPLAFVTTIALLLIAAAVAFPLFGIVVAGLGAAGWWFAG
jgi:hypothetical protein